MGGSAPVTVSACPTSVTLFNQTSIPISADTSDQTGYGEMAGMMTNPTTTNWSSAVIKETVTPTTSTCPSSILPQFSTVTTLNSTTFNVGIGATLPDNSNYIYPAITNVFYDLHATNSPANLLAGYANVKSCTASAAQTYVCGGSIIGSFTITKTLTQGTANGKPATIVTVSKR